VENRGQSEEDIHCILCWRLVDPDCDLIIGFGSLFRCAVIIARSALLNSLRSTQQRKFRCLKLQWKYVDGPQLGMVTSLMRTLSTPIRAKSRTPNKSLLKLNPTRLLVWSICCHLNNANLRFIFQWPSLLYRRSRNYGNKWIPGFSGCCIKDLHHTGLLQ
jgi:hypothetical protein